MRIAPPFSVGALARRSADTSFGSVTGLWHFNDGNGATTFVDKSSSALDMSAHSTGSLGSSTQFKWNTSALRVSGSTQNARANLGSVNTVWNFGTGDFTIEWWQWLDALTLQFNSIKEFIDFRPVVPDAIWVPTIYSGTVGDLRYFANSADRITATSVLSATTWQHIAACRVSGSTRLFVNGTQAGSTFTDSNTYVSGTVYVGSAGNGGGSSVGYYNDLRITKGVGRYSSNFTPPTAQFPDS